MRALLTSLLFAGSLLSMSCASEAPPAASREPRPSRSVPLATAALDEIDTVIRATGSVEPWVRTLPGTKILGRITAVPPREGDRVRKGDLLVRLDDLDLRAAVNQARAALAMAEAQRENAMAQHRRMTELRARESVTEKSLEDAVSGLRVAEAAVQQAEAALASAEVMLGYAEVRAPIDGWVVERRAEVGGMTAPGAPLFVIEDLSQVKIVVRVPESEVIGMERGDSAVIEVDVLHRELPATIHRVVPAGDPATRTYDVYLVVENDAGTLKSGMFTRVRFLRGTQLALQVPETAVVTRGQLRGLFVVDESGTARLRWVRLGRADAGRVEVLSGLELGERYVATPPPGFADATPVEG